MKETRQIPVQWTPITRRRFLTAATASVGTLAVAARGRAAAKQTRAAPIASSPVAAPASAPAPTSAAADWNTRISNPGVVWYHNFDSAAEVNNFRWTGGYAGGNDPLARGSAYAPNIAWVPSGGADGGGYLRLYRPTGTGGDGTHWIRMFNPLTGAGNGRGVDDPGANGALAPQTYTPTDGGSQMWDWYNRTRPGWYGHASYHSGTLFDGEDFYLQVRVKIHRNRTAMGNVAVGKLLSASTTRNSYTQQEIVTYSAWPTPSGVGTPNIHNVYQGHNYSPISDVGMGTKNPTNWAYSFDWDTLLYHITPGRDGVNETRLEVWAAHAGESSYAKIWDVMYPAHFEAGGRYQKGWNAWLCWIYQNGLYNTAFYQSYDQIIFSKAMIPCPKV